MSLFKHITHTPQTLIIMCVRTRLAGIQTIYRRSIWSSPKIRIRRVKYLNNIVEQDHRAIKRRISITTGFKEFESAQRTLAAIETTHMIRKNQIKDPHASWFETFKSLAV